EERPVSADSGTVFVGLGDVVGANRDEPAVGNFELAMEFHEQFRLAAVLGAEASAAEDENHGMRSLQLGELAAPRGVIGKLVVGKNGAGNNVRSHGKTSARLDARCRAKFQDLWQRLEIGAEGIPPFLCWEDFTLSERHGTAPCR